ncbi:MAG: histidine kinase dimerization/phospho-acceptor domain-containing protein [Candidatus Acidiferrum sp.]
MREPEAANQDITCDLVTHDRAVDEKVPEEEQMDFGAILRHELNNPLTGILGNAELLLAELQRKNLDLPEQARIRLETIAELAVRMRDTVRRLSEEWQAQAEGHERDIDRNAAPRRVA